MCDPVQHHARRARKEPEGVDLQACGVRLTNAKAQDENTHNQNLFHASHLRRLSGASVSTNSYHGYPGVAAGADNSDRITARIAWVRLPPVRGHSPVHRRQRAHRPRSQSAVSG